MITVKELFEGAVEHDMKLVAHTVFWAMSERLVSSEDDSNKLHEIPLNQEKIQELAIKNVLGIERIKLFVIRTTTTDLFAFYFAENALDASGLHQNLFGEQGTSITNGARLMPKRMFFEISNVSMNFYEYRKRFVQFPVYVGHATAGESVCVHLSQKGVAV